MTMPRQKDLKRLVRARMRKTGEAYTAARAQILKKQHAKSRARRSTVCGRRRRAFAKGVRGTRGDE
jgi:hypothetical protein